MRWNKRMSSISISLGRYVACQSCSVLCCDACSMQLRHDVWRHVHMFQYQLSVVDHLLIVHNMRANVSMMFDVRTDGKAALAAPMPIGECTWPVDHGMRMRGRCDVVSCDGICCCIAHTSLLWSCSMLVPATSGRSTTDGSAPSRTYDAPAVTCMCTHA